QQAGKQPCRKPASKTEATTAASTGRVCQVGKAKKLLARLPLLIEVVKTKIQVKKVADNNKDFIDRLIDPRIGACSQCGKGAGSCRRCGACTNRWYCGRECQRKDWQCTSKNARPWPGSRALLRADWRRLLLEDDDVVADDHGKELLDCCGSSAFALPNMFVGRLFMGALPGSVFLPDLANWRPEIKRFPIPVYLIDSNNAGADRC
uniref:MYND-type domain-containing protein n=1 Tax=Macrostomum lignano TaxID=282301 RepID=A0A1I8FCD3_9PLAT